MQSCAGPLAIKAGAWTVAEKMHASRIGLLYSGPVTTWPGICYLVMTIFALDYLHDSWFYWTHRLLHWAPIYRHVHYIHHRSSVPTAFTGYSFHILEAILVFANEVFICFLFPIHMGLHRVYHMFTTIIHNGGHAGYEIAPFVPSLESALYFLLGQIRLGHQTEALNTVMHHDMHHRFPKYHFSLYMTHWDRWMGTEHPNYRHQVLIKASGMSK